MPPQPGQRLAGRTCGPAPQPRLPVRAHVGGHREREPSTASLDHLRVLRPKSRQHPAPARLPSTCRPVAAASPTSRFAARGSSRQLPRSQPAADTAPVSRAAPLASSSRVTVNVADAEPSADPFHVHPQPAQLAGLNDHRFASAEVVQASVDLTQRDQRGCSPTMPQPSAMTSTVEATSDRTPIIDRAENSPVDNRFLCTSYRATPSHSHNRSAAAQPQAARCPPTRRGNTRRRTPPRRHPLAGQSCVDDSARARPRPSPRVPPFATVRDRRPPACRSPQRPPSRERRRAPAPCS